MRIAHSYLELVAQVALKQNKADIVFVPHQEDRLRIFTLSKRVRDYVRNCLGPENVDLTDDASDLFGDCRMQTIKLSEMTFQDVVNALGGFIEEVIEIGDPPKGVRASYLQEEEEAE